MHCVVVEQVEASCQEFGFDLVDLGLVAGFQFQLQVTAGDGHVYIAAVVLYANHVGATIADDFANLTQLTRTVVQYDHKVGLATGSDLAAGDNARKDIYIDIATGNEANSFLAFDGQLIENGCGHGSCASALSDELLFFYLA